MTHPNRAAQRTRQRAEDHTSKEINERIQRQTEANIAYFAERPDQIDRRLAELDQEWNIERSLAANAATLGLAGVLLGAFADRRFLVLPAVVTGFLLQHAVQGWCPPLPVFRRLGVRTAAEIERERYALKSLRGDFGEMSLPDGSAQSRAGKAASATQD